MVLPGLFLASVIWLAARMAVSGDITIGQLVAIYGYVMVLIVPVWFFAESAYFVILGRVSARRIIALLNLVPDDVGARGHEAAPQSPADLHDPDSGLTVRMGRLVGVAADDPAEGLALADRLGRFVASEVTWGGVPLTRIALPQVRERILVADHDSYLFAGELREILAVRPGTDDDDIRAALHTASAQDVADTLPDGLDSRIEARARTLSGGQRQRIRLARALLVEPEVLILVDPTSAVDAHTEARIAQRLRAARDGRTTVVVATSPLLLGHCDVVAHLRDGQIVATGSHTELLDTDPTYRALVSRDSEEALR
jgi:ABC-type multidrug transport system fused ATPase/permease subunit